uniref:Uncharacterized protein n=1 Tax=Physcomitrium patens TaxID=3218 RepID=A0A2K1K1F9_PHYPA|nr:hypothetical protein PHYPA_012073 [Physcomitrium patens]
MDEEGGTVILGAILPSYGMVFTRSNPSRSVVTMWVWRWTASTTTSSRGRFGSKASLCQ